jgi:hypothetical protein
MILHQTGSDIILIYNIMYIKKYYEAAFRVLGFYNVDKSPNLWKSNRFFSCCVLVSRLYYSVLL